MFRGGEENVKLASRVSITTVCDNTVRDRDLLGEHGLSVLVETPEVRVLFDTGSGLTLLHNAEKIGIDLSRIDVVALSHGHDDHTSGLKPLLLSIKRELRVYGHPDIFTPKHKIKKGHRPVFIGIPQSRDELESLGAGFYLNRAPTEITPNLILTGEIPRTEACEEPEGEFYLVTKDETQPDRLLDDQALLVKTSDGLVVILGCAHSGVANTLKRAVEVGEDERVLAVIGGFHLHKVTDGRLRFTVRMLEELGVKRLAPCHCTGLKATAALTYAFRENLVPNHVGVTFEFK